MALEPVLHAKIHALFAPHERAEAERIVASVNQSLPLPAVPSESDLLKVRAGVLKLSEGSLERLAHYAREDWRSVLVWSGFQSTQRCRSWLEE